jgi:hypothetical protein
LLDRNGRDLNQAFSASSNDTRGGTRNHGSSPWGSTPAAAARSGDREASLAPRPPPGFTNMDLLAGGSSNTSKAVDVGRRNSDKNSPPFLFSNSESCRVQQQLPFPHRTLFGGTTYVVPEEGEDLFPPSSFSQHRDTNIRYDPFATATTHHHLGDHGDSKWNAYGGMHQQQQQQQHLHNKNIFSDQNHQGLMESPSGSSIPRNVNVVLKDDLEEASVISFLSDTTFQTHQSSVTNALASAGYNHVSPHSDPNNRVVVPVAAKRQSFWDNSDANYASTPQQFFCPRETGDASINNVPPTAAAATTTSMTVATPTMANLKEGQPSDPVSHNNEKHAFQDSRRGREQGDGSREGDNEDALINPQKPPPAARRQRKKQVTPLKNGGTKKSASKSEFESATEAEVTSASDKISRGKLGTGVKKATDAEASGHVSIQGSESASVEPNNSTDEGGGTAQKKKKKNRKKNKRKIKPPAEAPDSTAGDTPLKSSAAPLSYSFVTQASEAAEQNNVARSPPTPPPRAAISRLGGRLHSQMAGQHSCEVEGNAAKNHTRGSAHTLAAAQLHTLIVQKAESVASSTGGVETQGEDEEDGVSEKESEETDETCSATGKKLDDDRTGAIARLEVSMLDTASHTDDNEEEEEKEMDDGNFSQSSDTEDKDVFPPHAVPRSRLESNMSSLWDDGDGEDFQQASSNKNHDTNTADSSSKQPCFTSSRGRAETGDSSSIASLGAASGSFHGSINKTNHHHHSGNNRGGGNSKRSKNRRHRQRGSGSHHSQQRFHQSNGSTVSEGGADHLPTSFAAFCEGLKDMASYLAFAAIWVWSNLGFSSGYRYLRSIPYRTAAYQMAQSFCYNAADICQWAGYLAWDGVMALVSFLILLHKLALKEVIQNHVGFVCYTFCTCFRTVMLFIGNQCITPHWFPQLLWIIIVGTAVCWNGGDYDSSSNIKSLLGTSYSRSSSTSGHPESASSKPGAFSYSSGAREEGSRKKQSRRGREQVSIRDSGGSSVSSRYQDEQQQPLPFPVDIMWPITFLRVLRLCMIVLWCLETITISHQGIVMDLTGAEQVLVGFSLATIKMGYMLSPIAWISWSIQVLMLSFCRSTFVLEHSLLVVGLATLHIIHKVADRSVMIEATDGGIRLELGDKCGLMGGESSCDSRFGLMYSATSGQISSGGGCGGRREGGDSRPTPRSKNRRRVRSEKKYD